MKINELRKLHEAKKARWVIPDSLDDEMDIEELEIEYGTGVLPLPTGVLTARKPRIRKAIGAEFRYWDPNIPPILRPLEPALPDSWDWRDARNNDWVHPIRNQGGCGSCVAFATAAALEAHWRIENNNANLSMDLSEASMFFTSERQCFLGDPRYGWWITSALDFLMDEGVCDEENYPYQPVNQNAQLVEGTERTLKIQGYDSTSSTDQMKRWLVEEGPLITAFTVYQDFLTYWNGGANGVYSYVMGASRGGHAVLVVGYDDGDDCWICKNSWGTGNGSGYFRIEYGECGIDTRMYLLQDPYRVYTVDELHYNPRNLRIVSEGARGWLLTDGRSRMKMFHNKEDARNGLRVARRHTRHGFVGRDNTRANRRDYITEYWAGDSHLPYEPLTKTDCISYNPNNVVAEDLDDAGWRLRDGDHWMVLADDMNDALAILRVIERHTRICFIGRDNPRPNRSQYIMTYWE